MIYIYIFIYFVFFMIFMFFIGFFLGGLKQHSGRFSVCPLHLFALCEGKALRNSSPPLFQPDTRAQH